MNTRANGNLPPLLRAVLMSLWGTNCADAIPINSKNNNTAMNLHFWLHHPVSMLGNTVAVQLHNTGGFINRTCNTQEWKPVVPFCSYSNVPVLTSTNSLFHVQMSHSSFIKRTPS